MLAYILNMNISMISNNNGSHNVLYLRPLQIIGTDLHLIFESIRNDYLKYHIKMALMEHIPPSYLYYSMNIIYIIGEEYTDHRFSIKFSNIRGFKEQLDRYIKLRNYIYDRRLRNYREEE